MQLTLSGMTDSRAVGDPLSSQGDEDCAIYDITVLIFRSNGLIDTPVKHLYAPGIQDANALDSLNSGTGLQSFTFPCTTAATKVYVICNATTALTSVLPDGSGPATMTAQWDPFAGIRSETQLKALSVCVFDRYNTQSGASYTNYRWHVLMSGNAPTVEAGTNPDGTKHYTATVPMQFIPAKINVTLNNEMYLTDGPGPDGVTNQPNLITNTQPLGVAIVNGADWTRFVATDGNPQAQGFTGQGFEPARGNVTGPFFANGLDMNPYYSFFTIYQYNFNVNDIPYADEPFYNGQPDDIQYAVGNYDDSLSMNTAYYGFDGHFLNWLRRTTDMIPTTRSGGTRATYNPGPPRVDLGYRGLDIGMSWSWNNTLSQTGMHDSFYVYPGSWMDPANKTYLVVFGKYNVSGSGASAYYGNDAWKAAGRPNIFWSMPFDSSDLPPLQAGWKYNVVITLKGNASFNGGGSSDPTVPPDMSGVQIQVLASPWNVVPQNMVLQ